MPATPEAHSDQPWISARYSELHDRTIENLGLTRVRSTATLEIEESAPRLDA